MGAYPALRYVSDSYLQFISVKLSRISSSQESQKRQRYLGQNQRRMVSLTTTNAVFSTLKTPPSCFSLYKAVIEIHK